MAEDSSSIPGDGDTTSQPARRPGRNRRNRTPLVESFKEFVDNTPAEEVQDLSDQLHKALGSIANGPAGGVMSSCVARVQRSQSIDVPTAKISDSSISTNSTTAATTTTTTNSNDNRLTANPQRENRTSIGASMSIDVESSIMRRMSGDEYYAPKSSSRRNSRAGSELAASMKLHAQQALAELGEISDDDDDDQVIMGVLGELKEEPGGSFRIVQEGDIDIER